ncbi:hypothetical protein ACLKA7_014651 [Drosophila subpalustris]
MPRERIKKQLTKRKLDLALWELELLDDNEHAAYDEVMDELMEDILTISSCRRGIEFSVPKSFDWRTHVLPNLNEDRFLQMLRVTKMQFQTIVEFVRNDSGFKSSLFRPQISVEQQVAIVLFRLGSSGEAAAIRKIATLFGVGDGGTIAERKKLALETIHELPYCIGYIDGSEIKLARTPQLDHESSKIKTYIKILASEQSLWRNA